MYYVCIVHLCIHDMYSQDALQQAETINLENAIVKEGKGQIAKMEDEAKVCVKLQTAIDSCDMAQLVVSRTNKTTITRKTRQGKARQNKTRKTVEWSGVSSQFVCFVFCVCMRFVCVHLNHE